MKKFMIVIILSILFLTGCMKLDDNVDNTVNEILSSNEVVINTTGYGFSYYKPIGVIQVASFDNNVELRIKSSSVYLYVDIIGYYYKNSTNNVKENNYNYYYKELNYNNTGFIGINKNLDNYFIEISYGYAKIEGYATNEDFNEVFANMLIIVNNIKYNDNVIESLLSNNGVLSGEVSYEIDKPESAKSNFSQYLQDVVEEEDEDDKLPDVE